MSAPKFFIISGTSGSGKTIALQVLEDLGFYCIDNLPASLVPEMAARVLANDSQDHNCAFSIDSRNQDIIGDLETSFNSLKAFNVETRVIFLDADDDTLLKRYSETRRKHPLSDGSTSLREAIHKERELLKYLQNVADRSINTAKTTPHELRRIIRDETALVSERGLTLLFQSFGFKYGGPTDADFVFDVRCLPNPHWHADLKPLTGLDTKVIEFFLSEPLCEDMYNDIKSFVETWLPHFIRDNRNYITVGVGCTGGQHRSVYLTEKLKNHFKLNAQIHTLARHREINVTEWFIHTLNMIEQQIEIINKLGLHARASAKLVNTANGFASRVEIEHNGQTADAKSIMQIMMLAASIGSMVTIRTDGKDEEQAIDAVTTLINNYFDEEE